MKLQKFDLDGLIAIDVDNRLNMPSLYIDEPLYQVCRMDNKDDNFYGSTTVLYRKVLSDKFFVAYSYFDKHDNNCFSLTRKFMLDFGYDTDYVCLDDLENDIKSDDDINIMSDDNLL